MSGGLYEALAFLEFGHTNYILKRYLSFTAWSPEISLKDCYLHLFFPWTE